MTDIDIVAEKADKRIPEKSLAIHIEEERLKKQVKDARELFSLIQDELDKREEGDFKDGLSFLDMKNDTLLSYMIDLCNIVLLKVRNQSIEGHQSVERTIEYRVILDKIKTIDQRLAYQLNKLITTVIKEEELEGQRVDLQNLDVDIDSEDESEDDESEEDNESENDKQQKPEPYRPPKLRSVVYDDKRQRGERNERDDDEYQREKTKYEEEHFTRLVDSKNKRRKKMK